jgi:hypothetical protein
MIFTINQLSISISFDWLLIPEKIRLLIDIRTPTRTLLI